MATTFRKRSDTELPKYHRNFSLNRANSPLPLQSDSTIPPVPAVGAPAFTSHRRSRSFATVVNSTNSSRPSQEGLTASSTADADTVYYRNTEARNKLKQYLTSPQRFDEVLTYGFVAPSGRDTPDIQDKRTSSANAQYESRSPCSETPDLEDHVSFNASETGTDSPATPADPDFAWRASKFNRVSIFGGLDTDAMPSFELDLKFIAEKPEPSPLPPPVSSIARPTLDREMTLRMTLTRPDLRANEEEMYGFSRPVSKVETLSTPMDYTSETRMSSLSPVDRGYLLPEKVYEPSQTTTTKRSFMPSSAGGISRFLKRLRRT